MELIHLPEVGSTNNYLRQMLEQQPELPEYTIVDAYAQTEGRGQRGNSWESNAGENISCSILLRPNLPEEAFTFDLNIVVSLALHDALCRYLAPESIQIKWSNDIIVGHNRKIAGILIENEWLGSQLEYSIIGIGLNVRQTAFGEYHPVATSLALEGAQLPLYYEEWHPTLIAQIASSLQARQEQLGTQLHELRQEYHSRLLGLGEERSYALPNGTQFLGTIRCVHPNGLLEVDTPQGIHHYHFKEIRMLL